MSKTKNDLKRQAALNALLECDTLTAAANAAGISRRTLYNYIHWDEEFARAYKEIQEVAATSHLERLISSRSGAADVLEEIMRDINQPAAIRIKAAQATLQEARLQAEAIYDISKRNIKRNKSLLDTTIE